MGNAKTEQNHQTEWFGSRVDSSVIELNVSYLKPNFHPHVEDDETDPYASLLYGLPP